MYDYIKQHRWAKLKVGLVVTICLIIIFVAVMFAGNIEKFFVPRVTVYAMVDDVKGLREGSPVWFSGVEIGSVKSIDFTLEHKVRVEMSLVSDALYYLKGDSRANILTLGLLGDKYVELTPGSKKVAGLKAGDSIAGVTQVEIKDVVQTSQASIEKISDFVGMLEEILLRVEKGEGTISRLIQDPAVYDNLKDAIAELTTLVGKVEAGKGTVGRLINEDDLYVEVSSSVKDISAFAASLRTSEGSLSKVINDTALYDRFQRASESLDVFAERLASSKGTINRLIEDDSLYRNIDSASGKLNSVLDRIDNGEGLMGSLVKDDELKQELESTLKELNGLIRDIKERPGDYFRFSLF